MEAIAKNTVNEIVNLHTEIEESLRTSLQKAIRIGLLLTEVKADLKHGQFTPWLSENLPFTVRTAQRYMTLFENKDKVLEAGNIATAYRMLEEPKSDTVSYSDDEVKNQVGLVKGLMIETFNQGLKLACMDVDDESWKSICDVCNKIEFLMKEGETVTGFTHKNFPEPTMINITKCAHDNLHYEFVYLGEESGHTVYSQDEVSVCDLMQYLLWHPKVSVKGVTWAYPGSKTKANRDEILRNDGQRTE